MATKKTTVEEISVEDKLKLLFQLQGILSKIDEIRTLRGELPHEVEDLEDEVEGLKTRITKIQEDIETIRVNISEFKNKIEIANSQIAKYQEQLDKVRNNREYDTINKEIEFQGLEIELCNKRIRESIQADQNKKDYLAASQQALEERENDLQSKQVELEEIITETKAEEERLRDKAKDLELQIEPRLLTSFKRIRKSSRNGLGIVYVQRDACGGCFSKIPPQKQLDVRMRKKIIVCEYCGRILIDPELAGIKEEVPQKEEKKGRSKRKKEETSEN